MNKATHHRNSKTAIVLWFSFTHFLKLVLITSYFFRFFDTDVPVCQHREAVSIVAKISDGLVGGPAIRCRAGRGHPPTIEYHWTFVPEPPADPDTHRVGRFDSDQSVYDGRPGSEPDALQTATAVQNGGGGGGTSYTFTTSTPVLKSYVSAVMAAASASYNGARLDFLHGRLECRAVNEMGVQIRPCVYRITGKTFYIIIHVRDRGFKTNRMAVALFVYFR